MEAPALLGREGVERPDKALENLLFPSFPTAFCFKAEKSVPEGLSLLFSLPLKVKGGKKQSLPAVQEAGERVDIWTAEEIRWAKLSPEFLPDPRAQTGKLYGIESKLHEIIEAAPAPPAAFLHELPKEAHEGLFRLGQILLQILFFARISLRLIYREFPFLQQTDELCPLPLSALRPRHPLYRHDSKDS